MKTLYLHIGTPKTGTSTLQHFLYDNRKVLENKGIYYPIWNNYKAWGGKESTDGNFGWITRSQLSDEQKVNEIIQCFKEHDKVLFSTENIWLEILDKGSFLSNFKLIDKAIQIKVIVYLRKQIDYFESQYRECVRLVLLTEPIRKTIDFTDPMLRVVKDSLSYLSVLDNMAEVIGIDNVLVRVYEKEQFLNGNIIEDFLDLLDLKLTEEFIMPKKNYNPSMSNSALELKRYMNTSGFATQAEMNECFYEILMKDGVDNINSGKVFNFKTLLSLEQRRNFMERFKDENCKLARKYLHRENGILFMQEENSEMCADKVSTQDLLKESIRVFTSVNLIENQKINYLQSQILHENARMEEINKESVMVNLEINKIKSKLDEMCRFMEEEKEYREKELEVVVNRMREEVDYYKNSNSWKVTAPLRKIRRCILKDKQKRG